MQRRNELVGLTEIAQRAGVQKPVVSMWRTRYETFPRPAALLATGPVWFWEPVKEWLETTGRQTDAGWTRAEVNRASSTRSTFRKEQASERTA